MQGIINESGSDFFLFFFNIGIKLWKNTWFKHGGRNMSNLRSADDIYALAEEYQNLEAL